MDNAGLSEQPSSKPTANAQGITGRQVSESAPKNQTSADDRDLKSEKPPTFLTEDIPELVRETPDAKTSFQLKPIALVSGVIGIAAIALAFGGWFAFRTQQSANRDATTMQTAAPSAAAGANQPDASDDKLLGHFPYAEAPLAELQSIVPDGSIKLRKAAATEFQAMVNAARADGVLLVPISGFRSQADQQHLFFDVKAERGQVAAKRAEVSAPPGYSEHHTGYAVDVGDGNVPALDLNPAFEKTTAFKWLQANAAHFSFELSFTRNNRQGVSYEPWHWRYVGDRDSLETFYKARRK